MLTEEGSRVIENGIIITIVGGVITVASYLFGIIRAFYYPHTYNKKLKAALWLESAITGILKLIAANSMTMFHSKILH